MLAVVMTPNIFLINRVDARKDIQYNIMKDKRIFKFNMDKIIKFYHQVPTPNAGLEKDVKSLFYDFVYDADMASKGKYSSVTEVLNTAKSRLDVLDARWQDEVKRVAIRGKKTKRMFVSSLSNDIRIYRMLEKKFNYNFTANFNPLTYTNEKFKEAMYMEISLYLAKYGFVYEFEVMASAMHLLFKFFNIMEVAAVGYEWTFKPYDINQIINDIKENDSSSLSIYYDFMIQNVEKKEAKLVHYKKQKPQSATDLFIGFNGATRADFVRYCSQTWDVTAMTVSRWIKKFEITDEQIMANTDLEEQLMFAVEEQQQKLAEAQKKLEEYRMSKTIKNS